jgi:hypothetical protein
MICKLCRQEKELIGRSHIIPKFLYSDLYDEKHRLIKFDALGLSKGKEKNSSLPTSPYEKFILCKNCDNVVISQYEFHFSQVYKNSNIEKSIFPEPEKINQYEFKNLDYNKTNIFFLSLLWRAHYSTLNEFKEVKLESKIERKLRRQILNGVYEESTVKISAISLSQESDFNRTITQFKKLFNSYSFIMKNFIVFFHLDSDNLYNLLYNHNIKENGKWIIPEIPKKSESEFIRSYIGV